MELHYRLKTVVICDMQLNRFPHDIQNCTIKFESCELSSPPRHCCVWIYLMSCLVAGNYPTSEIHLEWDTDFPIGKAP